MSKIYLYGNCQTMPLSKIINRKLGGKIKVIQPIAPVHLLKDSDKDEFISSISSSDIFIYQEVKSMNYGWRRTSEVLNFIDRKTQLMTIPSIYFDAYFDPIVSMKNEALNKYIPYHNTEIIDMFLQGRKPFETFELLLNKIDSREEFYKKMNSSLMNLKNREKSLDVKISDFIESEFFTKRLFWTPNHPSNFMLDKVANEIILNIGEAFSKKKNIYPKEFLGDTSLPLNSSFMSNFNCLFDNRISVKGRIQDLLEYVRSFYLIYNENKKVLVEEYEDV